MDLSNINLKYYFKINNKAIKAPRNKILPPTMSPIREAAINPIGPGAT